MNTIKKISKRGAVAFLIFSTCIVFAIPTYLILAGLWNITDCPADIRLPLWMIGFGILIVVERLLYWKRLMNEMKFARTFPRPDFGSSERMRTWEKNKTSSTPKGILYLVTCLRNLILVSVISGALLSHDFIFRPETAGQCSPTVAWSVFCVSTFSLLLWAFAIIGTLYIHFARSLSSFENTSVASLNRIS